jgi:hypothetical protein
LFPCQAAAANLRKCKDVCNLMYQKPHCYSAIQNEAK